MQLHISGIRAYGRGSIISTRAQSHCRSVKSYRQRRRRVIIASRLFNGVCSRPSIPCTMIINVATSRIKYISPLTPSTMLKRINVFHSANSIIWRCFSTIKTSLQHTHTHAQSEFIPVGSFVARNKAVRLAV